MALKLVTLTGADETADCVDLLKLLQEYSFLELGFLFSQSRQGKEPRYPALDWISGLLEFFGTQWWEGSLSAHLCGAYARSVLQGEWTAPAVVDSFDRVQLNIAREEIPVNIAGLNQFLVKRRDQDQAIIIQAGANLTLAHTLCYQFRGVFTLFDRSGGEGRLPVSWPMVILPMSGYAGGLSPDNLAEQLPRIADAAGNCDFWIDTESGIRTDDRFDLNKARRFLDIAAKWVKP